MSMARTQLSHSTIDRMNKPESVGPAVSFDLWEKIPLGCKLLQFFPCMNPLPNVSSLAFWLTTLDEACDTSQTALSTACI